MVESTQPMTLQISVDWAKAFSPAQLSEVAHRALKQEMEQVLQHLEPARALYQRMLKEPNIDILEQNKRELNHHMNAGPFGWSYLDPAKIASDAEVEKRLTDHMHACGVTAAQQKYVEILQFGNAAIAQKIGIPTHALEDFGEMVESFRKDVARRRIALRELFPGSGKTDQDAGTEIQLEIEGRRAALIHRLNGSIAVRPRLLSREWIQGRRKSGRKEYKNE